MVQFSRGRANVVLPYTYRCSTDWSDDKDMMEATRLRFVKALSRQGDHDSDSGAEMGRGYMSALRRPMAALPLSILPPLTVAQEAVAEQPWMNATLHPETRTRVVVAAMTEDEKLTLMLGYFGNDVPPKQFKPPAGARPASAGYVPGIPRL